MKTKLIPLGAIASIAIAGTLIAVDPAPYPPTSSSPAPAAAASSEFLGKITAMDKEAKTITLLDKSGKSLTLHLGDSTKLSRGDNETATWDDLKIGQEIQGMHKTQGSMSHAETLTISTSSE